MTTTMLLPYDVVEPFLSDNSLCQLSGADPKAVYECLLVILAEMKRDRDKATEVAGYRPKPSVPRCTACKIGFWEIDTKEAYAVCSECGVVAQTNLVLADNCTTFNERHDDGQRHHRTSAPDVPQWMQKALDYTSEELHRFEVEGEIDSLNDNPFVAEFKLFDVDKRDAKRYAMLPARANAIVRATAALVAPRVDKFFDMDDIRSRISEGRALPIMRYESPRMQYKCNRCGVGVSEPYMQRRHPCEWGKRPRKRSRM